MVSKLVSGKSIRGALNYNERKVEEGKAELLYAHNYPKDAEQLSFNEKFKRLQHQADLSEIKHKCLHVSLNFEPTEHFNNDRLQAIAEAYMQKIGFGDQPFLVYRHFDAAHPHLHIVTTTVKQDGQPIYLHNNWKASEKARKEIEEEFSLIRAEGKSQSQGHVLKPIDLEKAVYGKSETKLSISNIVRSVIEHYKFTSLPEFNAILSQFNVIADRGQEGTEMYEKGGLVYSLVDQNMIKVGVPIKASSIYDRPILSRLQKKFELNNSKRMPYKNRIASIIDDVLRQGTDKIGFKNKLAAYGINVIFRQNNDGKIYGITYIDNKTYCVFNGTDLGSSYKAKPILERLQTDNSNAEILNNRQVVEVVLQNTDFKAGIRSVLSKWAEQGVMIDAKRDEEGNVRYAMGHQNTSRQNYQPLDYKMSAYLKVNDLSPERSDFLQQKLSQPVLIKGQDHFTSIVDECFSLELTSRYLSKELLEEAKKKKKRRR